MKSGFGYLLATRLTNSTLSSWSWPVPKNPSYGQLFFPKHELCGALT